jgi:hypothetical protein
MFASTMLISRSGLLCYNTFCVLLIAHHYFGKMSFCVVERPTTTLVSTIQITTTCYDFEDYDSSLP